MIRSNWRKVRNDEIKVEVETLLNYLSGHKDMACATCRVGVAPESAQYILFYGLPIALGKPSVEQVNVIWVVHLARKRFIHGDGLIYCVADDQHGRSLFCCGESPCLGS